MKGLFTRRKESPQRSQKGNDSTASPFPSTIDRLPSKEMDRGVGVFSPKGNAIHIGFGSPLELLEVVRGGSAEGVPIFLVAMVDYLRQHGTSIPRLMSLESKRHDVDSAREYLMQNRSIRYKENPIVVACLFKQFLSQLPSPVVPYEFFERTIFIPEMEDHEYAYEVLERFQGMALVHFLSFKYILSFFGPYFVQLESTKQSTESIESFMADCVTRLQKTDSSVYVDRRKHVEKVVRILMRYHAVFFQEQDDDVVIAQSGLSIGTHERHSSSTHSLLLESDSPILAETTQQIDVTHIMSPPEMREHQKEPPLQASKPPIGEKPKQKDFKTVADAVAKEAFPLNVEQSPSVRRTVDRRSSGEHELTPDFKRRANDDYEYGSSFTPPSRGPESVKRMTPSASKRNLSREPDIDTSLDVLHQKHGTPVQLKTDKRTQSVKSSPSSYESSPSPQNRNSTRLQAKISRDIFSDEDAETLHADVSQKSRIEMKSVSHKSTSPPKKRTTSIGSQAEFVDSYRKQIQDLQKENSELRSLTNELLKANVEIRQTRKRKDQRVTFHDMFGENAGDVQSKQRQDDRMDEDYFMAHEKNEMISQDFEHQLFLLRLRVSRDSKTIEELRSRISSSESVAIKLHREIEDLIEQRFSAERMFRDVERERQALVGELHQERLLRTKLEGEVQRLNQDLEESYSLQRVYQFQTQISQNTKLATEGKDPLFILNAKEVRIHSCILLNVTIHE
eukprot:TRINITY_DN1055_c0_g1_i1.p1 TRINITY_DN1055_c0_g1~~TRINITY_DN1055_c0_g1_i1.p1  ORF type:complete len:734 (+),score=145.31 TRINITY_DN1055_c0_g1_i1:47-2248(+)